MRRWGARLGLVERLRERSSYRQLGPEAIDPALPNRMLAGYCASREIPCMDLTPALAAAHRASPEPLYKRRDTHWTVRGNREAASRSGAGPAAGGLPKLTRYSSAFAAALLGGQADPWDRG